MDASISDITVTPTVTSPMTPAISTSKAAQKKKKPSKPKNKPKIERKLEPYCPNMPSVVSQVSTSPIKSVKLSQKYHTK